MTSEADSEKHTARRSIDGVDDCVRIQRRYVAAKQRDTVAKILTEFIKSIKSHDTLLRERDFFVLVGYVRRLLRFVKRHAKRIFDTFHRGNVTHFAVRQREYRQVVRVLIGADNIPAAGRDVKVARKIAVAANLLL